MLSQVSAVSGMNQKGRLMSDRQAAKGKWIKRSGTINCSICKHSNWSECLEDVVMSFNYCPNCGAEMESINKITHETTESDKVSYSVICNKSPSPHIYFNTYEEAEHWARFDQPNYRPYYIIKCSEHFEIVGEIG